MSVEQRRSAHSEQHGAPSAEKIVFGGRLERLRTVASAINAGGDIETVLDRVLLAVCRGEPWSRGGIMAVNRQTGFSEMVTGYDPERTVVGRPRRWALATSPVSMVSETRQPLVIDDAQRSGSFPGYQEDARQRGYRTVVILPLGCTSAEEHEMVLSLHTRERTAVTEEELAFLVTVAHLVALAVEKVKHLQREQRQRERLQRVLEAGTKLMEMVLDGEALPVVAGMAGAILPHAMVVFDFVTGQAFASGSPWPDRLDERSWRELMEGKAGPQLAGIAARSPAGEVVPLDLSALGVPALDVPAPGLAEPVLATVEPLRVEGETAGLLVVFPGKAGLDNPDRVALQEVRFALAAQVMRHHTAARQEVRDLTDFLEQLLRAGAAEPARMQARALRLGLDLLRPTHLLAIALPRPVTGMAELRRFLSRGAGHLAADIQVIEQGDHLAILLPDRPGISDALLERLFVAPVRSRWGLRPVLAHGPLCAAPGDYGPAWEECRRVLDLARTFGREGLVRQSGFGSSALLLSAFNGPLVQDFVEVTLGAVRRHEAEHGGDLLRTVSTFIDEACRYHAAAKRLGIHVSTLRYRLRRLQELFGLDLEDPETRFRLSFAQRLVAMGGHPSEA